VVHKVKGHTYFSLEQAYWVPGVGPRRRYIAYLGKNVQAYGLPPPSARKRRAWTYSEQIKLYEIAEFRGRQSKINETRFVQAAKKVEVPKKKRGRGRPRKRPRGRTKTGQIKRKAYKRTKLTGLERQQLRKSVLRAARQQKGDEYADNLMDYPIADDVDETIGYEANKKILFEKYGLDPDYKPPKMFWGRGAYKKMKEWEETEEGQEWAESLAYAPSV